MERGKAQKERNDLKNKTRYWGWLNASGVRYYFENTMVLSPN